ncbi:type III-A CRISPR-associated RAMP protein Csm5 [Archaeoglobales archaeon]|nr:MAG: type III-A CRISPR-associated RAMP protein Csm5 [Archaeoglobales archaeon]
MKIEVISPVHVGSGSGHATFDYFYQNGKVRIIDYERAYREDERIRRLIDSGRFDPRAASRYYKYEVDAFCNPDREIFEHIKVTGRPYIPGSSLKGTIRTAILWKYLRDNNKKVKSKEELSRIEKELFGKSAHDDFMKFLLVRDTDSVSLDNLAVYETIILTEKVENGKLCMKPKTIKTKTGIRPIKIYTESLKPGTELSVEIKPRKNGKLKYLENWAGAVAEFSKHIIEIEREFFEVRNLVGEFDVVLNFIDDVRSKLDSGEILFRLGFSTGGCGKQLDRCSRKRRELNWRAN